MYGHHLVDLSLLLPRLRGWVSAVWGRSIVVRVHRGTGSRSSRVFWHLKRSLEHNLGHPTTEDTGKGYGYQHGPGPAGTSAGPDRRRTVHRICHMTVV
jgi:hypothetical protein